MADHVVTPTVLVMDTVSANVVPSGWTSIVAAATDFWSVALAASGINVRALEGTRLLLGFLGVGSDNVTILAGDRPPSQRADLGSYTFAIASTNVKFVCVETARFLQNDGTIRASVDAGDTTRMAAFLLPRGLGGDAI